MVDWFLDLAGRGAAGGPQCVLCGARGDDFCAPCYQSLPWLRHPCIRCALPLATANALLCGSCQRSSPPYSRCIAPLEYRWPANAMITEMKSHARFVFCRVLTNLLLSRVQQTYAGLPMPALLLATPISTTRLQERGFNQAWRISKQLAKMLGIPASDDHLKSRDKRQEQKKLSANARQQNLNNTFSVVKPVSGHVALIDDVVTTGATASVLASLLLDAGAQQVDIWCLARTPRPGARSKFD